MQPPRHEGNESVELRSLPPLDPSLHPSNGGQGDRKDRTIGGGLLTTRFQKWLLVSTRGDSIRAIAAKIGYSPDSVARWRDKDTMPAEVLVRLVRVYDADLVEGALAAGIVTEEDIQQAMPALVRGAPTVLLTEELHRRATSQQRRTSSSPSTVEHPHSGSHG
jgi:hypothetical protein